MRVAGWVKMAALLVAVAAGGCGAQTAATGSSQTPAGAPSPSITASATAGASAQAVVRQFYELLSANRVTEAGALVVPNERAAVASMLAEDPAYVGLTDLQCLVLRQGKEVAKGGPPAWAKYVDLCEIESRYVTHKASVTGAPSGQQARFAVLGRQTADGPWLLVDSPGTGP